MFVICIYCDNDFNKIKFELRQMLRANQVFDPVVKCVGFILFLKKVFKKLQKNV
jgi:hypothetical protein